MSLAGSEGGANVGLYQFQLTAGAYICGFPQIIRGIFFLGGCPFKGAPFLFGVEKGDFGKCPYLPSVSFLYNPDPNHHCVIIMTLYTLT